MLLFRRLFYSLTSILLSGLFLDSVEACTVCFGGADNNMIRGFTWGIILLLSLPFLLSAGIISMIVYSIKKRKSHV